MKTLIHKSAPGGLVFQTMGRLLAVVVCTGSVLSVLADPQLVSNDPPNGATGVAVDAPITFTFDTAMFPNTALGPISGISSGAIAWSGNVNAQLFTFSWSSDNLTLTCTYSGGLPENSLITWALNPPSSTFPFQIADQSFTPLPPDTYSGSFTTGAGGGGGGTNDCNQTNSVPSGFGSYNLTKSLTYDQTSTAAPSLGTNSPALFSASVNSPTSNPVTAASLKLPSGSSETLSNFFGAYFFDFGQFDTQQQLDSAYPSGTYQFLMTRTSGPASAQMTVPDYPPIPQVANFDAAQNLNPTTDFTLQWNVFTNADPTDYLSLTISDGLTVIFQAPDNCVPRPLTNTATSIVIPAGTLKTNQTYNCDLTFSKNFYFNTNAVAGMAGFGSVMRQTQFTIKTTGSSLPPTAPQLINSSVLPNGHFHLILAGQSDQSYVIEASPDLSTWTPVVTNTAPVSGQIDFEDTTAGGASSRFYRGRIN